MDFIFYLTLFLFVVLFGTIDNSIDYDFWARLTVGKSFFQTGELFQNEFQSYGTTHEFIDHEWGSSLVFYLIQENFSDIGLFIFKSIIIFLTLFIITKIIRLKNNNIKLNFLFFFFALQSISYTVFSTIRCQTFSFLFFAIYFYILEYSRQKKNYRILWCLPFLNIIWLNMHGGFVLGIALIFLYLIGELLNNGKNKFSLYLIYTFFTTLLTCLINPYGIKYLVFIFEAFKLNRIHITEWQSAFFNKNYYFLLLKFKLFFFPTILLFLYSIIKQIKNSSFIEFYKKIDKTKYLILLFTMLIALKALRCHVFFTYSVLILCYSDFYNIFNKKLPATVDKIKDIIIFILILISTISHLKEYKFLNTVKSTMYPIYCIDFIKENNIKGNVFANFHLGSYVSYKLYPNNYIFMDGRYEEVYDVKLIDEMGEFFLDKNYKSFLDKYHSDILIIENYYPVVEKLKQDKNWFSPHKDDNFTLFLSKKYKNMSFKKPHENLEYYYKTKFKTNINWIN